MERYFQNFYLAAQTYQGRVEQTAKEEILYLSPGKATYDARTGLLIKSIISKLIKVSLLEAPDPRSMRTILREEHLLAT